MRAHSQSLCLKVGLLALAFVSGAFGLLGPGGVHAQSSAPRDQTWVTDGPVYAIACAPTTVYIGGSFTRVKPVVGASVTRYNIAALDAATGQATAWNPDVKGGSPTCVNALAVSGSTVYVGGNFTKLSGQTRNYLGALNTATGGLANWNPNANAQVRVIAVSGSTVYVGGDFTTIGGQTRNYAAALDAATGSLKPWNPNANGPVCALAISDSTVYAGGYFTLIGEQLRNRIAALDAATGAAKTWNPNQNDPSGGVLALALWGTTVYAGGPFLTMGEQTRNHIAALDAATGAVTAWNPGTSGTEPFVSVNALAVSGWTILAGGRFTGLGGQLRNHMGAVDAVTGNAMAWNPNASALVTPQVSALAVSGSAVYAGGDFTTIGGASRPYFAQFDLPAAAPAAPSNPGADLMTTGSIRWTWRDNSTNEDSFRVWADPGIAAPTTLRGTTAANATNWIYTGLLPNNRYTFQVAATNVRGASAKALPLTAWTLAIVPKPPVLDRPLLDSVDVTLGSGDGNPSATEYAIYCSTAEQWVQANGALASTMVWATAAVWGTRTVSGLRSDTLYQFQVKAHNGAAVETAFGPAASLRTMSATTARRWRLY